MTNIKYFGFAKASSSVPILSYNLLTDSVEEIQIEVAKVFPFPLRFWEDSKNLICGQTSVKR